MPNTSTSESVSSDKEEVQSGRVHIQSQVDDPGHDRLYVSCGSDKVLRADQQTSVGENTIFHIIKLTEKDSYAILPQVYANRSEISFVTMGGDEPSLKADRIWILKGETFEIKKEKTNVYTIKSKANNKYVTNMINQGKVLVAQANKANEWEFFNFYYI